MRDRNRLNEAAENCVQIQQTIDGDASPSGGAGHSLRTWLSRAGMALGRGLARHDRRPLLEQRIPFGVEGLESRQLLSTIDWTGLAFTDDWHDPLNWTGNRVPHAGDDVKINGLPNPPTIVIRGDVEVARIKSSRPLVVTNDAHLNVTGQGFTDNEATSRIDIPVPLPDTNSFFNIQVTAGSRLEGFWEMTRQPPVFPKEYGLAILGSGGLSETQTVLADRLYLGGTRVILGGPLELRDAGLGLYSAYPSPVDLGGLDMVYTLWGQFTEAVVTNGNSIFAYGRTNLFGTIVPNSPDGATESVIRILPRNGEAGHLTLLSGISAVVPEFMGLRTNNRLSIYGDSRYGIPTGTLEFGFTAGIGANYIGLNPLGHDSPVLDGISLVQGLDLYVNLESIDGDIDGIYTGLDTVFDNTTNIQIHAAHLFVGPIHNFGSTVTLNLVTHPSLPQFPLLVDVNAYSDGVTLVGTVFDDPGRTPVVNMAVRPYPQYFESSEGIGRLDVRLPGTILIGHLTLGGNGVRDVTFRAHAFESAATAPINLPRELDGKSVRFIPSQDVQRATMDGAILRRFENLTVFGPEVARLENIDILQQPGETVDLTAAGILLHLQNVAFLGGIVVLKSEAQYQPEFTGGLSLNNVTLLGPIVLSRGEEQDFNVLISGGLSGAGSITVNGSGMHVIAAGPQTISGVAINLFGTPAELAELLIADASGTGPGELTLAQGARVAGGGSSLGTTGIIKGPVPGSALYIVGGASLDDGVTTSLDYLGISDGGMIRSQTSRGAGAVADVIEVGYGGKVVVEQSGFVGLRPVSFTLQEGALLEVAADAAAGARLLVYALNGQTMNAFMAGAVRALAGEVILTGDFTFDAGSQIAAEGGIIRVQTAGDLLMQGQVVSHGGFDLDVAGALVNNAQWSLLAGGVTVLDPASFSNSGVMEASGGATLRIMPTATGTQFNTSNSGILSAYGGDIVLGGRMAIGSLGTVLNDQGTVVFAGSLALNNQTLHLAGGGHWRLESDPSFASGIFSGRLTIDPQATLAGYGTLSGVELNGSLRIEASPSGVQSILDISHMSGQLTVDAGARVRAGALSTSYPVRFFAPTVWSGDLQLDRPVQAAGSFEWRGGDWTGNLANPFSFSGGVLTITGADRALNARLNNGAQLNWTGGRISAGPQAYFNNFGTWINSGPTDKAIIGGAFTNYGAIINLESSNSIVGGAFTNLGEVTVQGGTLSLAGGGHAGAFSVWADSYLNLEINPLFPTFSDSTTFYDGEGTVSLLRTTGEEAILVDGFFSVGGLSIASDQAGVLDVQAGVFATYGVSLIGYVSVWQSIQISAGTLILSSDSNGVSTGSINAPATAIGNFLYTGGVWDINAYLDVTGAAQISGGGASLYSNQLTLNDALNVGNGNGAVTLGGATLRIDAPQRWGSLTMVSSGEITQGTVLRGASVLFTTGASVWAGGSVGPLTGSDTDGFTWVIDPASPSASLSLPAIDHHGGNLPDSMRRVLNASIELRNDGNTWTAGRLDFGQSARVRIGVDAVFTVAGGSAASSSSLGLIVNDGTLRKSTFDAGILPGELDNNGLVLVSAGSLLIRPTGLSRGELDGGVYDVASGGSVLVPGALLTNSASVYLRGPGAGFDALATINLNTGELHFEGGRGAVMNPAGGTLSNQGILRFAGGSPTVAMSGFTYNQAAGASLRIEGGTVTLGPGSTGGSVVTGTLSSTLAVAGARSWNSGFTSSGPGLLNFAAGAAQTFSGNVTFATGSMSVAGTWHGGGRVTMSSATTGVSQWTLRQTGGLTTLPGFSFTSASLTVLQTTVDLAAAWSMHTGSTLRIAGDGNNGTLNVLAGGSLTFNTGSVADRGPGGGNATINNAGLLRMTYAGNLFLTNITYNHQTSAAIEVSSAGWNVILAGGTITGTLAVSGPGQVQLRGLWQIDTPLFADGPGFILPSSGATLNFLRDSEIRGSGFRFADIWTGPGRVIINGTFSTDGPSWFRNAGVTLAPGAAISAASTINIQTTLDVAGTWSMNNFSTLRVAGDGNNGTLNLLPGGSLTFNTGSVADRGPGGGNATLNNAGLLRMTYAGNLFLTSITYNHQTSTPIEVSSAGWNVILAGGTITGTLAVAGPGQVQLRGPWQIDTPLLAEGSGFILPSSGATLNFLRDSEIRGSGFRFADIWTGPGRVIINGTFSTDGPSWFRNAGVTLATGAAISAASTIYFQTTLDLAGTLTLGPSVTMRLGGDSLNGVVNILPAGSLNVHPGAVVENGPGGGAGSIVSSGTIAKFAGSGSNILVSSLHNLGVVRIDGGPLLLPPSIQNYSSANRTLTGGVWRLAAGATLSTSAWSSTGIAAFGPGTTVIFDGPGYTFAGLSGSLARNDGLIILRGDAPMPPLAAGTFTNAGELRHESSAFTTFPPTTTFSNTGTLRVTSGTFSIPGTVQQIVGSTLLAGTWIVQAGLFTAGIDFGAPGRVASSSATVVLSGPGGSLSLNPAHFTNNGSVSILDGAAFAPTNIDNMGTILLRGSTLAPASLSNAGGIYVEFNAVLTTPAAGMNNAQGVITIIDGRANIRGIAGGAVIVESAGIADFSQALAPLGIEMLTNRGIVILGERTLDVSTSVVQTATGTLRISIHGPALHGRISGAAVVSIDGGLELAEILGTPPDVLDVVTGSSITGAFAQVRVLGAGFPPPSQFRRTDASGEHLSLLFDDDQHILIDHLVDTNEITAEDDPR